MNIKKKIIIVCGLPGTGKSTFAIALSEAIGGVHLNTDKVRSELNLQGRYSDMDKASIYQVLLRRTRDEINRRNIVILDGTFYTQAIRQPFVAICEEVNVKPHWIEMTASEDVVRNRVAKQRPYTEADFQVYHKIRDVYDPLTTPHLLLDSGQMSMTEMVNTAIEYLENQ